MKGKNEETDEVGVTVREDEKKKDSREIR